MQPNIQAISDSGLFVAERFRHMEHEKVPLVSASRRMSRRGQLVLADRKRALVALSDWLKFNHQITFATQIRKQPINDRKHFTVNISKAHILSKVYTRCAVRCRENESLNAL